MSIISPDEFFQKLLEKTKKAFDESAIYQKQKEHGNKWNYSVCGTPIQIGKGILMGINWGADGDHDPQSVMPDGKDIAHYNFIKRSKQYLEEYLHLDFNTINFNYANLCFFRSQHEADLINEDYKQSLSLFKEYAEFIQPPWIFSLADSNSKRLQQLDELKIRKKISDSQGKFKGIAGTLWGFPYFSVPHPNAHLSSESRDEIWKGMKKDFDNRGSR